MLGSKSKSYLTPEAGRRYRAVGVASLLVGLLSALVSGMVIVGEPNAMGRISQDQVQRGPAYSNEFQSRHFAVIAISSFAGIELAVAVLLIIAAIMLLSSHYLGVVLHWWYAASQLCVNVFMSVILTGVISDSPAGMLFYLGAIPGLILSIYPIGVLIMLGQVGESDKEIRTAHS